MARNFRKYPSNYIRASYSGTEPLSSEEREEKRQIIEGLDALELLSLYKKYLLECGGGAITAPDHKTGDILDLLESEVLHRLGYREN